MRLHFVMSEYRTAGALGREPESLAPDPAPSSLQPPEDVQGRSAISVDDQKAVYFGQLPLETRKNIVTMVEHQLADLLPASTGFARYFPLPRYSTVAWFKLASLPMGLAVALQVWAPKFGSPFLFMNLTFLSVMVWFGSLWTFNLFSHRLAVKLRELRERLSQDKSELKSRHVTSGIRD
jgi:hypothetical protein